MKLKTDEPFIPEDIRKKITVLQHLLDQAESLRDEILTWYEAELHSYDPKADPESEFFDPGQRLYGSLYGRFPCVFMLFYPGQDILVVSAKSKNVLWHKKAPPDD